MSSSSKWYGCSLRLKRLLRFSAVMTTINLTHVFKLVAGDFNCKLDEDCGALTGYVCHNSRCVCGPTKDANLFTTCLPVNTAMGIKCRSDNDCNLSDYNLMCAKIDKSCKCRRGFTWDYQSRRCYKIGDDDYGPNKIGTVSDLVSTLIFVLGIGAMMYLLIKLFCNCSKLWRRGNTAQRADIPRSDADQQCIPMNNAPGTWVASYRVIGALEHSPSSQFSGRNPSVPPYLLLPTPGSAPPPYEEALKHKVILSSYPSQPPLSPSPLPQPQVAPSSPQGIGDTVGIHLSVDIPEERPQQQGGSSS